MQQEKAFTLIDLRLAFFAAVEMLNPQMANSDELRSAFNVIAARIETNRMMQDEPNDDYFFELGDNATATEQTT
jgi:hypothetical protein